MRSAPSRTFSRIHAARKKVKGIEIWAGTEVDIMGDGTLDYSNELLKQFDIVLASVHSRMNMPAEEMTARLLRALENPYVRILGHPTGRLILRRDPFLFDMEKVFAAAKKFGVILEVNASPERLDLCDRHVKLARDRGMKIIISTDAHDPQHFKLMRYGVIHRATRLDGEVRRAQYASSRKTSRPVCAPCRARIRRIEPRPRRRIGNNLLNWMFIDPMTQNHLLPRQLFLTWTACWWTATPSIFASGLISSRRTAFPLTSRNYPRLSWALPTT